MQCPVCGHENDLDAKVCASCGKSLIDSDQDFVESPQSTYSKYSEPGRGGLILTLGILSIACFGFFAGIPAWIMGYQDLKKINLGIIPISQRGITKGGMICGIIGTIYSSITIIVMLISFGLGLFSGESIEVNRYAMISDINDIAAYAIQYRTNSGNTEEAEGSFEGFNLPEDMASNDNAIYYAKVISSTSIKVTAVSNHNEDNKIIVYISKDGNLYDWTYTGDFH